MQNNSPTEAGHSNLSQRKKLSEQQKLALIDVINQVFTLFRLNYHNQYLKAFGNNEELNEVKRLWLEMLQKFEPMTVLNAAKAVIENNEYLPTLRTMIYHCERCSSEHAFPEAHSAYLEACRAPSPKAAFNWSHPAVYHAGRRCDWYFLQTNSENIAFPVFKKVYEEVCHDIRNGTQLDRPQVQPDDEEKQDALSKEDNQQRLHSLRASLEL